MGKEDDQAHHFSPTCNVPPTRARGSDAGDPVPGTVEYQQNVSQLVQGKISYDQFLASVNEAFQ